MTGSFSKNAALLLLACLMFSTRPVFAQETLGSSDGNGQGIQTGAPESDDATTKMAVDNLVNSRMQEFNVPGYSLVVIKKGRVLVHNSYGMASIEQRRPATNETVFGLASITKTFTALVLLSLVDKGLIGLDDPLSKFMPDLTPQYAPLTIRQLASMRAGVPNKMTPERPWPAQINDLINTPLVSQPDSQYLYSNFSYRLLGQVIENVTRKSFMENVREVIFQPVGMNMSGTVETLAQTGLVAQPYGDQNGAAPLRPIQYKPPVVTFSAGMIATNSDDMLRYVQALMNRQLLSPAGYKTLWYERPPLSTGEPANWAFGWGSKHGYGGKRTVSMNGGVPGIASSIIMLPEEQSAVIALSNLRKPPVYAIATAVAKLVFGPPVPSASEAGQAESETLQSEQNSGASED